MSTQDRAPGTSGTGGKRPNGDPLAMTEAEKRMAEWEARHDVAARGHRSPPDLLQHYLAHERLAQERLASAGRPAAGVGAHQEAAPTPQTEPQPKPQPATPDEGRRTSRRLLRRPFRRS